MPISSSTNPAGKTSPPTAVSPERTTWFSSPRFHRFLAWAPKPIGDWVRGALASPLGRRLAYGVFWSVAGSVFPRACALLVSIVTARLLGKHVFGELGIVQSSVNMLATFATLGMGLTATKHVAESRTNAPAEAGRIIGMSSMVAWGGGGTMALGLCLIAPSLAEYSLGAPHLAGVLRIAALLLVFSVVNEAQLGTLSGLEAFRHRSMAQTIAGLMGVPFVIAGVYFYGLPGSVWGLVAAQGLLVILNSRAVVRAARDAGVPISWKLSAREFRVLWDFGLPTLLGSFVYVPAMWLANTIIVNAPNGYSAMGEFSAADRWRTAIMFLPGLLGSVALPMLTNLRSSADFEKYSKVLNTNVRLSFLLSFATAVPIMVAAQWIMASYGPAFAEGRWVLVGLCVVAIITATSWILIQSIVSDGRMWLLCVLNLVWAAALLGTTWSLRDRGASALVIAYLLAESLRLLLVIVATRRSSSRTGPAAGVKVES